MTDKAGFGSASSVTFALPTSDQSKHQQQQKPRQTSRQSCIDTKRGRAFTNVFGLAAMSIGSLMAYFGFFAVNYWLYSLQFFGPLCASVGAFMIMISLVGHFVHREEKAERLRETCSKQTMPKNVIRY